MKKLVLLLLLAFPASAVAQETIYQYTTVPITYEEQNFLNLNQTQEGSNFWDDEVRQIDIGFDFTFYGETFNTLYLSNNGLLSFISPVNGCCSGEPLPTSSLYDYSIFFLWTDLVNIETFNPYISSYGTEGNRRLTIGFYDMPVYYDSTLTSNFEISLWEGTNYVFLNYGDLNTGDRTITAGLQGDSLLGEYTQLYYGNDATSTLSNTSWLFYSGVYIDPGPENPEEPPPPEEPQSPEVNCAVQFFDPSCQLADNDQQVNDPVVEEQFFSEERTIVAETEVEQEEVTTVEKIEETLVAETREATAVENIETSTASSTETIDSNVLDLVLAIVDATSSAPSVSTSQGSSQSSVVSSVAAFGGDSTVDSQQQDFMMTEEPSTSSAMIAESIQEFQQQDIVNEFGQIQVLGGEFMQQQQFDTFDENKIIDSILASGNVQEFAKQEEAETFSEPLIVMVDPMAQSQSGFNPAFSITNLEMAGVLNQREEKSDAEKRADQVIAANQEQQDAINANYMDADQGGILAAMDTGTDFTQYRNTMLRDVDFYKPEDIYKNVVYRDNVRGMYFLEKGSTDTYKKMVDEQYK